MHTREQEDYISVSRPQPSGMRQEVRMLWMEAIVAKSSEHVHRRPNSITGSEGGFQDLNKSGQGATLAAGKTT